MLKTTDSVATFGAIKAETLKGLTVELGDSNSSWGIFTRSANGTLALQTSIWLTCAVLWDKAGLPLWSLSCLYVLSRDNYSFFFFSNHTSCPLRQETSLHTGHEVSGLCGFPWLPWQDRRQQEKISACPSTYLGLEVTEALLLAAHLARAAHLALHGNREVQ